MFTEDEAKKKWCPMAKTVAEGHPVTVNRRPGGEGAPDDDCKCIASACMWWQWGASPRVKSSATPVNGWEHVPADDEGNAERWLEPQDQWEARRRGFCGMTLQRGGTG